MDLDYNAIIIKLERQHICNLQELKSSTPEAYFAYPRTLFKQHIFEEFRLYTLAALEQNSDINIGPYRFFLS